MVALVRSWLWLSGSVGAQLSPSAKHDHRAVMLDHSQEMVIHGESPLLQWCSSHPFMRTVLRLNMNGESLYFHSWL